ncbi:MAG: hypothetical protein ABH805_00795 [Candidatus Nealsonbacteria bacterium]
MSEINELLKKGQELYDAGEYIESEKIDNEVLLMSADDEEITEALRQQGWNRYYLAIKGPVDQKEESLKISEKAFWDALSKSKVKDPEKELSIFNGLPLAIWILGKKDEAWLVSDQATQRFSNEPSAWNTRGILCRWAKDFEQGVEIGEKVFQTALAKEDYRTAGHGKHNKADSLMQLDRVSQAEREYYAAVDLYKRFEEATGGKVQVHIEGVQEKLLKILEAKRAQE